MRRAVVIGAVGAAFIAFFGCSDDPKLAKLAEGCSINSDCANPLACAFGRCHTQCVQTRDCPAGLLCVSAGASKVCQLPEEAVCNNTTAKCPYGLICTDSTCRNACQSAVDCIGGQQCARGACYDQQVELDGGPLPTFPPDAAPADASIDAPVFNGTNGPLGYTASNFDTTLVVTTSDGGLDALPSPTISKTCLSADCLPPPTTIEIADGIHADLYSFGDLVVEQSAAIYFTDGSNTHPRPIIFAVAGVADIQGVLNVAGGQVFNGPGGFGRFNPGPGFGGLSAGGGGGGGGSYCGLGGHGIGDSGFSSDATKTYGTPEIVPLIGGSAGRGNNGDVSGEGRGAGGGVIQISAKKGIYIRQYGGVEAGGGGGLGGGSAGGAGGAILLEAPVIEIEGHVTANGGGGSGGPNASDGTNNASPAPGSHQYGTGGSGSAGTQVNGGDATKTPDGTTASGGGGAGRIRFNTASGAAKITGIVSPDLSTSCATQGTIKP